jgi:spore maturation protein CgeB
MMRSARAVLNISTKGGGSGRIAVINGRTSEAFAARATLIQYSPPENESLVLDELFTPGEEYFQFSSEKELIEILSLFRNDPQRIDEVARRGHDRYMRDYSARPGWARLLM